jgi:hypothetical protein
MKESKMADGKYPVIAHFSRGHNKNIRRVTTFKVNDSRKAMKFRLGKI